MAELLISELAGRFGITRKPDARYGDLLYFENLKISGLPYWARTVMLEPFILKFDSIGEAAGELKKLQRQLLLLLRPLPELRPQSILLHRLPMHLNQQQQLPMRHHLLLTRLKAATERVSADDA